MYTVYETGPSHDLRKMVFSLSPSITRGYECPICRKWFCFPPHGAYSCFVKKKCVGIRWEVNEITPLSSTGPCKVRLRCHRHHIFRCLLRLTIKNQAMLLTTTFPVSTTVGVQTFFTYRFSHFGPANFKGKNFLVNIQSFWFAYTPQFFLFRMVNHCTGSVHPEHPCGWRTGSIERTCSKNKHFFCVNSKVPECLPIFSHPSQHIPLWATACIWYIRLFKTHPWMLLGLPSEMNAWPRDKDWKRTMLRHWDQLPI